MEITNDGWYGVNLHYLPPKVRVDLMTDIGYTNKSYDSIYSKLLREDWAMAACKRYLASHVKGRISSIPKDDWDIVIQLPYEAFQNEINRKVWMDTRRKV